MARAYNSALSMSRSLFMGFVTFPLGVPEPVRGPAGVTPPPMPRRAARASSGPKEWDTNRLAHLRGDPPPLDDLVSPGPHCPAAGNAGDRPRRTVYRYSSSGGE